MLVVQLETFHFFSSSDIFIQNEFRIHQREKVNCRMHQNEEFLFEYLDTTFESQCQVREYIQMKKDNYERCKGLDS